MGVIADNDYLDNPLNYLLSVGVTLDLLEKYQRNTNIKTEEIAFVVHSGITQGKTIQEIFADDAEKYPDIYEELMELKPRRSYHIKLASEFGDDKTRFLWFPYVPIGDYTVLMAPGGTGKTYFICGLVAAISKGEQLPYDMKPQNGPQNALIISAEDKGELLKRRLLASGADLNRVGILDCMESEGLNFTSGYNDFKAVIMSFHPALVVIDPWHGFLGADIDINRVNAVRPCFQKLANLAKECECGMILISHVNKRAQGENINNAATGSTDFVNAARSALYCIFDEEDNNSRIIIHSKTNYAAYGPSVKFKINENGGVEWNGFSDIDRNTMEQAARLKKTAAEVAKMNSEKVFVNEALIRALLDAVQKDTKFLYDDFKDQYGDNIFGQSQPKKALDDIKEAMYKKGFVIDSGKQVRKNGKVGRGFSIQKISEAAEEAETSAERNYSFDTTVSSSEELPF